MKNIIAIVVLFVLLVGIYFGVSNHMENKAIADEEIKYTVHVMKQTDYGYMPKYDFEMSKSTLKAYVKLCYWEASWLDSGDLMIGFDADDETWFVKLVGNDPTIDEIKEATKYYGLKCSIP